MRPYFFTPEIDHRLRKEAHAQANRVPSDRSRSGSRSVDAGYRSRDARETLALAHRTNGGTPPAVRSPLDVDLGGGGSLPPRANPVGHAAATDANAESSAEEQRPEQNPVVQRQSEAGIQPATVFGGVTPAVRLPLSKVRGCF